MMEMRECKLFLENLSVCEQLSRRERAGKLGCSKNIKKLLRFQRRLRLAAKTAYCFMIQECKDISCLILQLDYLFIV